MNVAKDVSFGVVSLLSQNNSFSPPSRALGPSKKLVVGGSGGGWTYKTIGVIHAP